MNAVKKGQTATEYLIILAVVIVISLVVVGVLGGIPGIGASAAARSSAAYWKTQDVAITDYAVSASGADTIIVKNNLRNTITLNDAVVNSIDLESGSPTLGPGASKTYTGSIDACTAGQPFRYSVSLSYQDGVTEATYNITGDGTKLEGTCAS